MCVRQLFAHLFQVSSSATFASTLVDLNCTDQQDVPGCFIGDSFIESMLLCLSISTILLRAR